MTDPSTLLHDLADVYESKNDDYGNSWEVAGQLLWQMADGESIELESAEDVIRFGLWTRRMDKIVRAFNGEHRTDDLNHESVMDTHADEAVYAVMQATLSERDGDE